MSNKRLEQLLGFLSGGSKDPFIKYAIATEYAKIEDYESALKYYQDLVSNEPLYVGTYYHLGKLLEQLGRMDEAVTIYEKGMSVAAKVGDRHALSELQVVYQSALGEYDEDDDDDF